MTYNPTGARAATGTPQTPAAPANPPPPTPTVPARSGWLEHLTSILSFTQGLIPLLVAVAVLWWFGSVLKEMLGHARAGVTDLQWERYFSLYSGIEALAYAAAGFLFGREVNRQRADRAEEDAARSQQVANEAQGVAATSSANGRALAAALRSPGSAGSFRPESGGPEEDAAASAARLAALRQMADELFPTGRAF